MSYNLDAQVFETQIVIENSTQPAGATSGSIINKGSLSTFDTYVTGHTVVNNVRITPNLADIIFEQQAALANNQNSFVDITDFSFDDSICNSFKAMINVTISDTDAKHAVWEINGLYKPTGWVITSSFTGDITGVQFSIANKEGGIGQIQYLNTNTSGTTVIRYRASTTAPPGSTPLGVTTGVINNTSGPFIANNLVYANSSDTLATTDIIYNSNVLKIGGASRIVAENGTSFTNFSNGGALSSMGDASVAKKMIVGQKIGIATTAPGYTLDVAGDINFTGTFYKNNSVYSGSEIWNTNGNDVFYTMGNLGVGTSSPSKTLDVAGTARITTGLTTGTIYASNVTATNVSVGGLNATGLSVLANVTATNVSTGTLNATGLSVLANATVTNVSTGGLNASGLSVLANATVTNVSTGGLNASGLSVLANATVTNVSTGGLNASGLSVLANATATNVSTGGLNVTDITATNALITTASVGTLVNTNSVATNVSVGTLNVTGITASNINFTGNLYQNGSVYISSQWLSESGGALSYTTGNVAMNNSRITNADITTASVGTLVNTNSIATNISTGTIVASTGITAASAQITNVNATTISAGTLIGTTITGANLSLSGDLVIGGTLTTVNITTTNVVDTNITSGSINVTSLATINNATVTTATVATLLATNVSAGTIDLSTGITAGSAKITNANITTASVGTLVNTNSISTNISAGTIDLSTGITAGSAKITNANITTASVGTLVNTNSISTNISAGTIDLSTGITAGSAKITNANITTASVGTLVNTNSISTNISAGTIDLSTGITAGSAKITNLSSTNSSIGSFVSGSGTVGGHLVPSSNITYDLGSATQRWRDLYLSGNTIHLGEKQLSLTGDTFQLENISVIGTREATSTTSASIVVAGGVGISGKLRVAGTSYITNAEITSVTAATLNLSTGITTGSFNASGLSILANATATNASVGGLNASGLSVLANATATNASVGVLIASTGITTGSFNASGLSAFANATATNASVGVLIASTGITTASLLNTGLISTANLASTTATIPNIVVTTISAGTLSASTITGANLSLSGNLIVGGTLTTVNITSTNILNTNISIGTIVATGLSTLQNVTATNASVATLIASTGITTASAQITNANVTTSTIATARITSNLLALGNSNTVGSIFTTGGNVGINTASPAYTLDVAGTIYAAGTNNTNYVPTCVFANNSTLNGSAVASFLTPNLSTGVSYSYFGKSLSIGNSGSVTYNYVGSNNAANYIAIENFGKGGGIYLSNNGNTGINTASPGSSLHVAGSIPVSPIGAGIHLGIDPSTYAVIQLNSTAGSYIDFGTSGGDYQSRIIAGNTGNLSIFTNGASNNGYLGINTASPSYTLDVTGTGRFTGTLTITGSSGTTGFDTATNDQYADMRVIRNSSSSLDKDMYLQLGAGATSTLHMFSNNSETMTLKSGNVGIGTTSPSGMLHLNNAALFTSTGNLTCTGDIISFGSLSDRRLKKNIETIETLKALEIVSRLRAVTFDWREDIFNEEKRNTSDIGFIAQEVEALVPEAVSEYTQIESGEVYKNIKHERLVPYLLSAIQYLLSKQS